MLRDYKIDVVDYHATPLPAQDKHAFSSNISPHVMRLTSARQSALGPWGRLDNGSRFNQQIDEQRSTGDSRGAWRPSWTSLGLIIYMLLAICYIIST